MSQRLMLVSPEQLAWQEVPALSLQQGEIEVRTLYSAVSVGTEYSWFLASDRSDDRRPGSRLQFPRRMGYESLGIVTASRSTRAQPGDRVVSTYGHRTHAVLNQNDICILVPNHIPDEVAILSILSCEASRGAERAACTLKEPIAITGAGILGLLAVHRLQWLGFRNISVFEPRPERRHLAEMLGATRTMSDEAWPPETTPEIASKTPFAFGLECSSANRAFRLLQQSMAPGGSICVLSDGNYGPLTLDPLFHANELTIVGSSDGTNYEEYAQRFFAYWLQSRVDFASLFDHRIPSSRLIEEFENMRNGRRPLKILVSYE